MNSAHLRPILRVLVSCLVVTAALLMLLSMTRSGRADSVIAPSRVIRRHDFRSAVVRLRYQAWVHEQAVLRRRELAALHQDFWLHGAGTQLYTAWNTPTTLKAINWYGFEYAPFVAAGLDHRPLDSILRTIQGLGFNAVRMMFSDAEVESNSVVTTGLNANPDLRGLHSLDIMQRVIERAHHFGIRVILCNSRSEAGMGPERITGLWFTQQYPEAAWEQDWITLATRFRDQSAFVGADLRNEPHMTGPGTGVDAYVNNGPLWGAYQGTYYHARDWHYAAETLGNRLLAVNPHLLIIVEGVEEYYDPYRDRLTGALWGGNLIGVQYDPIVLDHPSQLVYSVHEYGPGLYRGGWFNAKTTYGSLARRWDRLWGYLLHAPRFMQAPIFVGEFGTCNYASYCVANPAQPASQGFWFSSFVRYMKAHPRVGWAYWALNPVGPEQPDQTNAYSILRGDWGHTNESVVQGLGPLLGKPNG